MFQFIDRVTQCYGFETLLGHSAPNPSPTCRATAIFNTAFTVASYSAPGVSGSIPHGDILRAYDVNSII